jgi:hypothetical protein
VIAVIHAAALPVKQVPPGALIDYQTRDRLAQVEAELRRNQAAQPPPAPVRVPLFGPGSH